MNKFWKVLGRAFLWGMAASLISAVVASVVFLFLAVQSNSSPYSLMVLPLFALASAVIAFFPAALLAAIVTAFEKVPPAEGVDCPAKRVPGMPLFLIPIVIAAVALPPAYFR